MATLDDLKGILLKRGGFTAVEAKASETQIRLEGRVPPNASTHWILVARALLMAARRNPGWSVDYSKHYFVQDGDKMRYAHRLIFQAPDISAALEGIIRTVQGAPYPARVELQEVPLVGAGAHRESTGGRGAFSVDKAPLAPAMMARAMFGGGNR